MTRFDTPDFTAEINLSAIDLINETIQAPTNPDVSLVNLNFNVRTESKADINKKMFINRVQIDIKNIDQTILLGNLVVKYTF